MRPFIVSTCGSRGRAIARGHPARIFGAESAKSGYRQHVRVYEGNTLRAGLSQMHGLRHAYAQHRYEELTGWPCPAAGGPVARDLTPEQRERDHEARLTISHELGHEREQVTVAYLGR